MKEIKNIEEIINLCKEDLDKNDENVTAILGAEDLKSLRNLLERYKELKIIEDSYKIINGWLRKRVKELEEEKAELKNLANNKQWISPCYVAQNYIPISKVKEKIEKLKQEYKIALEENSIKAFILKCQIQILQELLEG